MKLLQVTKIGFVGTTGDNRSPESFPFPAAMASILEHLEKKPYHKTIQAHGRSFTQRLWNLELVAASGIGFGLLWEKNLCFSAMDLLQAATYERGIANAFAWTGWGYDRVSGSTMREKAVAAIDGGIPFVAFGLTDPPEAALVCGYDNEGETLLGWSHFPENMETAENGMFRISHWESNTWELYIPTAKAEPSLTLRSLVETGIEILSQNTVEGYLAGEAAYGAWCDTISTCNTADQGLFDYHHALLFNLAEARCWCGAFLKSHGIAAGKHFSAIHNLCWKADAAAPTAEALASPEKRSALLKVLEQIRKEEQAALQELKEYLKDD